MQKVKSREKREEVELTCREKVASSQTDPERVRESVYSIEGLKGSSKLLCICLSCIESQIGLIRL